MRNFQLPGRSAVYASGAMAATSHPLATGAALGVMAEGGNAMDATVAASACGYLIFFRIPRMTLSCDCGVLPA
jgi:gamma-glutamyltranspeptidase/glutathione hydrolase